MQKVYATGENCSMVEQLASENPGSDQSSF